MGISTVLDAALAELTDVRLIEDFDLGRVAARLGVDEIRVKQFWPNTAALFTAALMAWGIREIPVPDTGTLRGDLLEYSAPAG